MSARTHAAAFSAVLFVLLTPRLAPAQSANEAKCRDTIAKTLTAYVRAYHRASAKCHDARSRGEIALSVDCNDAIEADLSGRLATAAAKMRSNVGGATNRCWDSDALLASQYPECPAPAENVDDGGATTGIDSFSELAECLLALTNQAMEPALDRGVGHPSEVLAAATADCQQVLAKALGGLVGTILRERRSCQRTIDKQRVGLEYRCDGADPNDRIGKALVKLNAAIASGCNLSSSELAKIQACSDTTTGLRSCVGDDTGMPLGDEISRSAYVLPGGSLPTTTTTLSNDCGSTFPSCGGDCPAGTTCTNDGSLCRCHSTGACAPATVFNRLRSHWGDYPRAAQTQLSTGWSGSAHQVDIPGDHDGTDAVDLRCDENCENCSVRMNPLEGHPQSYCRCANNPRTECATINGPDDACGTGIGNDCQCNFGGPLAISAGGTPVCVVNRIKNDFGGTANLRNGEWYDTIDLVSLVHLGVSTTAPCPTCVGDVTPNDGNKQGTCQGGVATGSCDVNGVHPTFGPVSYDCPPNSATNISGNGLQIHLRFTTGSQSLASALDCDNPGTFGKCPCRVCSGDGSLGCSSDEDCSRVGAGACTAGGGAGVKPNQCSDLQCSAAGRCEAGPTDTYCDGLTHPDGRGYLTCVTNADCAALGAGSCTNSEKRRCFPAPIVVQGNADPVNPVRSAIFCIPPTSSEAVNSSGGLPGPGTFDLATTTDIRCQGDLSEAYQLPDGSNCAPVQTTTTTVPLTPCADGTPPLCVGSCSAGNGCSDIGGGACGCTPTTTTTLPPCGGAFPLCSGNCAAGQLCLPSVLTQSCGCTVLQ